LVIAESQDLESVALQPGCSLGILLSLGGIQMMGSIDFDNQAGCVTIEVKDVSPVGLLTAELRAAHLSIAEDAPQAPLAFGLLRPQLTGQLHAGWDGSRPHPWPLSLRERGVGRVH
jgi:hypothetical protein